MSYNLTDVWKEEFRAMGTQVSASVVWGGPISRDAAQKAVQRVKEIFSANEKIFSRFDPQSELSRLNRNLGKPVEVSVPMREVLEYCRKFHQLMDGYFDPRVISHLEKIGYDKDFQSHDLNGQDNCEIVLGKIEGDLADDLKIDPKDGRVVAYQRIDTTGIAKGYTVDQAAEYLHSLGLKNFLVDAGGDMAASGTGADGQLWRIGVEGLDDGTTLIHLKDEGVATSGISRKRWTKGEKKFHHLVNPKNPEEFSHELKTVTVVADQTVEADGRAKSLFLMGREKGLAFADRENIKCLFLDYKNNTYVSKAIKENMV